MKHKHSKLINLYLQILKIEESVNLMFYFQRLKFARKKINSFLFILKYSFILYAFIFKCIIKRFTFSRNEKIRQFTILENFRMRKFTNSENSLFSVISKFREFSFFGKFCHLLDKNEDR